MAGYLGTKAVLLSTTAASVGGDATIGGDLTVGDGLTVDNDGATVLTVDRATSDGTLVDFQKNGTSVGSIGATGGDLHIGTGITGIRFRDGIDAVGPSSGTVDTDAATDLGATGNRFRNLYLSGGVYLGGTGSANKLEDYEEGTWTPSFASGSGLGDETITSSLGRYIKVGNLVTLTGWITVSTSWTVDEHSYITNAPFNTVLSDVIRQGGGSWGSDDPATGAGSAGMVRAGYLDYYITLYKTAGVSVADTQFIFGMTYITE
jgi:hypothetical protein